MGDSMNASNKPVRLANEILNHTEHQIALRYEAIKDIALSDLDLDPVARGQLDCPSILPGLARGVIAKVVPGQERLEFLAKEIPVPKTLLIAVDTQTVLERARFVGSCRTVECGHWTGVSCRLGHAIATTQMPQSVELPPCSIRSSCRWYKENGPTACMPCQHSRYVSIEMHTTKQARSNVAQDAVVAE